MSLRVLGTNKKLSKILKNICPNIYFVMDVNNDAVKIGIAEDVRSRLSGLRVGNPGDLELLCAVKGDRLSERHLHKKFSRYKIRGEWFRASSELLDFVERLSLGEVSIDLGEYV